LILYSEEKKNVDNPLSLYYRHRSSQTKKKLPEMI
jgi:hypothetical protein